VESRVSYVACSHHGSIRIVCARNWNRPHSSHHHQPDLMTRLPYTPPLQTPLTLNLHPTHAIPAHLDRDHLTDGSHYNYYHFKLCSEPGCHTGHPAKCFSSSTAEIAFPFDALAFFSFHYTVANERAQDGQLVIVVLTQRDSRQVSKLEARNFFLVLLFICRIYIVSIDSGCLRRLVCTHYLASYLLMRPFIS
jgi:hypothetical protein